MRTAGRAIVGVQDAEGVAHVHGLPGGRQVMSLYDAERIFEPLTERTS